MSPNPVKTFTNDELVEESWTVDSRVLNWGKPTTGFSLRLCIFASVEREIFLLITQLANEVIKKLARQMKAREERVDNVRLRSESA